MNIKNVTIAGSGVLGCQIAFQSAFHGFKVTVYDISDEVLETAKHRFTELKEIYKRDLKATDAQVNKAFDAISYNSDLEKAVKTADLVIEAIPEVPSIKTEFYTKLGKMANPETIFASNSSTLLPSQFAAATGRPEKFLNLHFANEIWLHNTAEIMGHPQTDPKVFKEIVAFAKAIGMVALPVLKEQPGYVLNSLLVPLLDAAMALLVKEVADPETIDKAWMLGTGAPVGPCGIYDVVGLNTVYNINKMKADKSGDEWSKKAVEYIKTNFIDKGKLGTSTGEGFYTYPNPAYKNPDFLK